MVEMEVHMKIHFMVNTLNSILQLMLLGASIVLYVIRNMSLGNVAIDSHTSMIPFYVNRQSKYTCIN